MTELQWLACTEPGEMLEFLAKSGLASERRCRLFACACVRRVWRLLRDERSTKAVEGAEGCADGLVEKGELRRIEESAWVPFMAARFPALPKTALYAAAATASSTPLFGFAVACARNTAKASAGIAFKMDDVRPATAELAVQAALVRDIFGPGPLSPSAPLSSSLLQANDGLVVKLARAAYDNRLMPGGDLDPARVGVLADALEEAGADTVLLNHLRQQGAVHVRGCWVIDLLSGPLQKFT